MSNAAPLVIAMPIRDEVTAPTRACLESKTDGTVTLLTETGLPVDVARNRLTKRILALTPRPTTVLWVDTDAVWTSGTFNRLCAAVKSLGPAAVVGPLHGPRAAYAHTHALKAVHPPTGTPLEWGVDYPRRLDDPRALVPIVFQGSHMYAHDIRLLERLPRNPWSLRPGDASEDFAFIRRVHDSGGTLWCDTACMVLHYDEAAGYGYLPGFVPPFVVNDDGTFQPVDESTAKTVSRDAIRRSYGPAVDERMRQMRGAA